MQSANCQFREKVPLLSYPETVIVLVAPDSGNLPAGINPFKAHVQPHHSLARIPCRICVPMVVSKKFLALVVSFPVATDFFRPAAITLEAK